MYCKKLNILHIFHMRCLYMKIPLDTALRFVTTVATGGRVKFVPAV